MYKIFAQKRGLLLAIASLMLIQISTPVVFAQAVLQEGSGRQTVPPSQMPQQPMPSEEFGNPNNVSGGGSNKVIDTPGPAGIRTYGSGTTQAEREGGPPLSTGPKDPDVISPPGYPSDVRIGPVEPIPMWQRGVLATFLLLQLTALVLFAIAMQLNKIRSDKLYRGGHHIEHGKKEEWLRSEHARTL